MLQDEGESVENVVVKLYKGCTQPPDIGQSPNLNPAVVKGGFLWPQNGNLRILLCFYDWAVLSQPACPTGKFKVTSLGKKNEDLIKAFV